MKTKLMILCLWLSGCEKPAPPRTKFTILSSAGRTLKIDNSSGRCWALSNFEVEQGAPLPMWVPIADLAVPKDAENLKLSIQFRNWCRLHPEGGTLDGQEITKQRRDEVLTEAEKRISEAIRN